MTEQHWRLHPERREGNGSPEKPVSRKNFMCAVEDCPKQPSQTRITEGGYYVMYCREHELIASAMFDKV